ncbi:MAG TPA: hypothetical protein ENK68_04310 [Epsilonproteobacteria bacterium]|nr:hypothetical protein [Campylobacterota bacterium]
MKSQLFILSKMTLISLFIAGCGGGSNSNTPSNTTKYDLAQYVVPSESQTNIYEETSYEKENGAQDFTVTNQSTYNEKYDINGSLIHISADGEMSESLDIEEKKIIRTFIDDNITMESLRSAMINDAVVDTNITLTQDDIELDTNMVCKLTKHLDEKKVKFTTYKDVLFVDCTQSSEKKSITVSGLTITASANGTVQSYFAKDIGLISSTDSICIDTEFHGVKDKSCYKDESNLITTVK